MSVSSSTAHQFFDIAPFRGEGNLYEQVAARIARQIEQGILVPGERIPSVRQLHAQLGVSMSTVLQAYMLLENQGLIEARPQSGYYVKALLQKLPPEPNISNPSLTANWVSVSELVMCVLAAANDPRILPLGAAIPGLELFPTLKLNQVLAKVTRRLGHQANAYEFSPGNEALRYQLARRSLDWSYGLSSEEIVTTSGCLEAVNLCLRAVAKPGDTIAVESPTYYSLLQLIESLGMKALEVPTHPRYGVCLEQLEVALNKQRIQACYFVLNFNNPLGSCMPDENKKQLVEMLTRYRIPLIEDDVAGDLYFGSTRPRTAKTFDREGLVLLCSSFSKALAPGYRVGWCAPGRYQKQVEYLKSITNPATCTPVQVAIAEFLQNGGYDRQLRRICKAFSEQVQRVSQTVGTYFPAGTRATRPTGGYVLWVELPKAVDSLELQRRALTEHISIAPGPIFSTQGKYRNFLRLNCGHPWSSSLEQGVITLGRLANELEKEPLKT